MYFIQYFHSLKYNINMKYLIILNSEIVHDLTISQAIKININQNQNNSYYVYGPLEMLSSLTGFENVFTQDTNSIEESYEKAFLEANSSKVRFCFIVFDQDCNLINTINNECPNKSLFKFKLHSVYGQKTKTLLIAPEEKDLSNDKIKETLIDVSHYFSKNDKKDKTFKIIDNLISKNELLSNFSKENNNYLGSVSFDETFSPQSDLLITNYSNFDDITKYGYKMFDVYKHLLSEVESTSVMYSLVKNYLVKIDAKIDQSFDRTVGYFYTAYSNYENTFIALKNAARMSDILTAFFIGLY